MRASPSFSFHCLWLGLSALVVCGGAGAQAREASAATAWPVEFFAQRLELAQVDLSPDGSQLALLANDGDRTTVFTRAIDGDKVKGALTTDNKDYRIQWARWVGNERLVVGVEYTTPTRSTPLLEPRLMSVRPDGTGLLNLVAPTGTARGTLDASLVDARQDQVIDWLPGDGRHILRQLAYGKGNAQAVYKVDVHTGANVLVKGPQENVYAWYTDAQHRVRVGLRIESGAKVSVRVCDPDGSNWRTAWTVESEETAIVPLGFGHDPQELFVSAPHEGRRALFTVRLDDPALPRTIKAASVWNAGSLLLSPTNGEVIGLRHAREASEAGWGSPVWRSQLKAVDAALPGRSNMLDAISVDEQRYVVRSSGGGRPGTYFVGDRRSGDLVELIVGGTAPPAYSWLGKRAVSFSGRDGSKLRASLMMPAGRQPGDGKGALAMVLQSHHVLGDAEATAFDRRAEFLASRGYAVLQVFVRAKLDAGPGHGNAGVRRWGPVMQEDLSDALGWAIKQNIADPARVCVMGVGNGGHAALMAAVQTPDAYRCVVSQSGITDLASLVAQNARYERGDERNQALLGDIWRNADDLRANSPASQASRIGAPVLLMHGADDMTVSVEQSRTLANALRAAGKSVRFVELPGGTQGLNRFSDRLTTLTAMEAFFAQHLAPPQPSTGKAPTQ